MGSLSKFLICSGLFLGLLSSLIAQESASYPIKVDVPVENAGTFTVSFDLLRGGGISSAARTLCTEQATAIGVTNDQILEEVCIPKIEDYITAVLLANKVVERKEPNVVTITIPIKDGEEYSISFDPIKSNALQTATAFCEQKQTELKIVTQEMMDLECIPKVAEFITRRLQPAPKETQTLSAVTTPVVAKTIEKDVRDIEIPIDNVGKLPLRLDIKAVSAVQAATFFCENYADKLNLKTTEDVNVCVPPISKYIQDLFKTTKQPNVQQFSLKVQEADAPVDFEFDVNAVSVEAAAGELCVKKSSEFGITQDDIVGRCVPAVSNFITNTLKQRNLV